MTKRFQNFDELTEAFVRETIKALPSSVRATLGFSNQSCSAYLNVSADVLDEDGDEVVETFKLRFSDHDDRYGADKTIRIEKFVTEIVDDGEYEGVEIEDHHFEALLAAGIAGVIAWRATLGEAVE